MNRLLPKIHSTELQLVLYDRCWVPLGMAGQSYKSFKTISSVGNHCGLSETGMTHLLMCTQCFPLAAASSTVSTNNLQVWIRNQLDVILCYNLFLLYTLLNMFRATTCPSSGANNCVVLSPRVGIVSWLQEGCQKRLAGSVSIEEFVAQLRCLSY